MQYFWYVIVVNVAAAFPSRWRKNVAENNIFDNYDSFFPKIDELPGFEFNSLENPVQNVQTKKDGGHIQAIPKTVKSNTSTKIKNITTTTTTTTEEPVGASNAATTLTVNNTNLEPFLHKNESALNDASRQPREEFSEESKEKESQEEGSSEEEPNMLTGLLAAFLGGLSRPDGSIDLEAILGLLGSLSQQNPDGSYDFTGLTETLKSFFGGGAEGGSDVGAFAGGLIGAIIRGLASPPGGAKGAGIFTGKILGGVLPALSAPPDPPADAPPTVKPPPPDSGGFASGLLKSIFQSSAGNVSKFGLIKSLIGLITSLSKTASSLSFGGSNKDWNRPPPPPPPV